MRYRREWSFGWDREIPPGSLRVSYGHSVQEDYAVAVFIISNIELLAEDVSIAAGSEALGPFLIAGRLSKTKRPWLQEMP